MKSKHFSIAKCLNFEPKGKLLGVYCLFVGSAFYVGASSNIRIRLINHLRDLSNGNHYDTNLQNEFNNHKIVNIDLLSNNPLDEEYYSKILGIKKKKGEQYYHENKLSINTLKKLGCYTTLLSTKKPL